MSIIRAPRPEANYYILDKAISEDKRLSWAARGLLIFLLGKPDNWKVSVAALINETQKSGKPSGRDAVYGLLRELTEAGYVRKGQAQREGGEFDAVDYIVSESPLTENPEPAPLTASPDTVQPLPANPTLPITDINQELITTKDPISHDRKEPAGFVELWAAYPKREGDNPRKRALVAYTARLKEGATPAELLDAVKRYARYLDAKGKTGTEYVQQAVRFLGPEGGWHEDWTPSQNRRRAPESFASRDYGQGGVL